MRSRRRRKKAAAVMVMGAAMSQLILSSDISMMKDIAGFRSAIRAAVRGYWRGYFDQVDFFVQMGNAQERYLTEAWHEGMAECGLRPEEMTTPERNALDQMLSSESVHLFSFAEDIRVHSRAEGGKLGPLMVRADMWINTYREAKARAMTMACADQKLVWRLGSTREHCSDCLNYNGRVYRASVWARYDIRPQHRSLSCRGYRCQCSLIPTNDPAMPGRPPGMSGG